MKFVKIIFAVLIVICSISCNSKNADNAERNSKWYKGNLHTHSYWSDGDEFPEVILDWYKSKGYHFLSLSDHNTLAEGEKWKEIADDSIYQNSFKNYLNSYGTDWVTHKIDSGKIRAKLKTYNEYRDLTEDSGEFLVIRSE